ncbi:MAG: hypothetical protein WC998_04480 [Candidatus Paceibacterota bacterium]|jgi:hypothetical protein
MAFRKPAGYDDAEAVSGGFQEPKAGPCVLGIVHAEVNIKDGEQQLVLQLDIAAGPFKNYYSKQSKRFDKNRLLRVWQNVEGKGTPYFKGLIKAIEESNEGFTFRFEDGEQVLEKKLVGGNLREEEYMKSDGVTVGTSLRVGYLCSIGSIERGEHKVMLVKKLKVQTDDYNQAPQPGVSEADFDQSVPAPEDF